MQSVPVWTQILKEEKYKSVNKSWGQHGDFFFCRTGRNEHPSHDSFSINN